MTPGVKSYTVVLAAKTREKGWIETLDDNWGVMYSRAGLETIMQMKNAAAKANADHARKSRTL